MVAAHRQFEDRLGVLNDLAINGFVDVAALQMETLLGRLLRQLPSFSFQRFPHASEKQFLETFRDLSARWACRSELACHARRRQYGYAGDHVMIDWIQNNRVMSVDRLGQSIDLCFQGAPLALAVRSRRDYIVSKIEASIAVQKGSVKIVCVSSGPANEIYDLAVGRFGDRCEFVCIDHSAEAVAFVKARAHEAGLNDRVHTIVSNPRELAHASSDLLSTLRPHIIFSPGLFDYLNDKLAARIAQALYRSLAPGGLLLFGNFVHMDLARRYNLYKRFMRWVLGWHLIYRTPRELKAIMSVAGIPVALQRVRSEPTGFNLFAEAVKA